jgi:hypothetical protein
MAPDRRPQPPPAAGRGWVAPQFLDARKACERSQVPTISSFCGILIQMFWRDHAPPHFHALYAEHEAQIDIRTFGLIEGDLPRRALALLLEWALEHRSELMENWDLCAHMKIPDKIAY